MKRTSDLIPFDEALKLFCSDNWATFDVHVSTDQSEIVLRSLLPGSRDKQQLKVFGRTPSAIRNLASVLRDSSNVEEILGKHTIRILRNLCVRSPENQAEIAKCNTHETVLRILKEFSTCSEKMAKPFYGLAVEFLVNFVTANRLNSQSVWSIACPTLFQQLMKSTNAVAAAASAALVHNCVATDANLLRQIVDVSETHSAKNGAKGKANQDEKGNEYPQTLLETLLDLIAVEESNHEESDQQFKPRRGSDAMFSWVFLIMRRLIADGLTRKCFDALGPSLNSNLPDPTNPESVPQDSSFGSDSISSSSRFTLHQRSFLHLLDAGIGKAAERGEKSNKVMKMDMELTVCDTEEEMNVFSDMLDTAFFYRDAAMIRCTAGIIASILIMNESSTNLNALRLQTVRIAIAVLQAVSSPQQEQPNEDDVAGLKVAIIRAVAICCDNCSDAQNLVLNLKGVPAVLNALTYEENIQKNPFLREWAVLAVRSLTLGNQRVVDEINSFEFIGLRNEDWLDKAGLEAFVDDKTGRARVRQKQS